MFKKSKNNELVYEVLADKFSDLIEGANLEWSEIVNLTFNIFASKLRIQENRIQAFFDDIEPVIKKYAECPCESCENKRGENNE